MKYIPLLTMLITSLFIHSTLPDSLLSVSIIQGVKANRKVCTNVQKRHFHFDIVICFVFWVSVNFYSTQTYIEEHKYISQYTYIQYHNICIDATPKDYARVTPPPKKMHTMSLLYVSFSYVLYAGFCFCPHLSYFVFA